MARIRQEEQAALSRGLATLYQSVEMASLSDRITRCLRATFDCELVSFDLIDLEAIQWNFVAVSPVIPNWEQIVPILQHHAHEHPILSHAARHHYPHAIRTSDLLSQRQYRQLGIYHDFFCPHVMRMDRQLGFVAKPTSRLTFGVSLNRRGRDFSVEQRALLELIQPHLVQAYLTAQTHATLLERIDREREGIGAALGGGLCELDRTGRILWASSAVAPLLKRYFPTDSESGNRLPAKLGAWFGNTVRARHKGEDEPVTPRRSWRWWQGQSALTVHLVAGASPGTWQLLLCDESAYEPSAADLADRHSLTGRESEVLYWIGQGKTNSEIGIILGIARGTVHKYVESVFNKLGVDNRTMAARIAMGK